MTLQAQLLNIIEEQQQQLKQQQKMQQESLETIRLQYMAIEELKSFTKTLQQRHSEAVKIVGQYQRITQELSEQTISPRFSQQLQANLELHLRQQLSNLVTNMNIDVEVKKLIQKELPRLVTAEIDKQTAQLAQEMRQKLDSVSNYHEKFEGLIQKISSRL